MGVKHISRVNNKRVHKLPAMYFVRDRYRLASGLRRVKVFLNERCIGNFIRPGPILFLLRQSSEICPSSICIILGTH